MCKIIMSISQKTKRAFFYNWDIRDPRDYKFQFKSTTVTPTSVDLRPNCPPVFDQGQLGSCGPNALSNALLFCLMKENASDGKTVVFTPSRLFIYYFARLVAGSPVTQDTGITFRGGLSALQKYGACKEPLWPYDISQFTLEPNQYCLSAGAQHTNMFNYYSIDNTDISALKQCLVQGFPFVLGISVYSSFEDEQTTATGVVPMPNITTETLLGGHALLCVGYNDTTQLFTVMNSWGTSVGDKGYYYLPYAYVTNATLCSDTWTIRFFSTWKG